MFIVLVIIIIQYIACVRVPAVYRLIFFIYIFFFVVYYHTVMYVPPAQITDTPYFYGENNIVKYILLCTTGTVSHLLYIDVLLHNILLYCIRFVIFFFTFLSSLYILTSKYGIILLLLFFFTIIMPSSSSCYIIL